MRAAQGVRTNMASYRAVMYAFSRAGDWASALGLYEDARREELQPSTGDLRTLVQVNCRITTRGIAPKTGRIYSVVQGLIRRGQIQKEEVI